jgi:hypothetical protein
MPIPETVSERPAHHVPRILKKHEVRFVADDVADQGFDIPSTGLDVAGHQAKRCAHRDRFRLLRQPPTEPHDGSTNPGAADTQCPDPPPCKPQGEECQWKEGGQPNGLREIEIESAYPPTVRPRPVQHRDQGEEHTIGDDESRKPNMAFPRETAFQD